MLKALPAGLFAAALVFPAAASAKDISIGATKTRIVAPSCGSNPYAAACDLNMTKITSIETKSDGVSLPTAITQPGLISSFTVGVWMISSNASTRRGYLSRAASVYGGQPAVRLTVLRHVGKPAANAWRVAAQSAVYQLSGYLGRVVEFPLTNPIPVTTGEALAISTQTWAPLLKTGLSTSQFSYSQSRTGACSSTANLTPAFVQDIIGEYGTYGCSWAGTRPEYSALEITSP